MPKITNSLFAVVLFSIAISIPEAIEAQQLRISIENQQPNDGFFLTPLWFGIHNGSFDYFDAGSAASGSLESLAEGGDLSGITADFASAVPGGFQGVILAPGGFGGAPVIDPGESAFSLVTVGNQQSSMYFSFGSMVIPSNDGFIGNDSGMQYQLFDSNGNFNGPLTLELFGADVWDSGTEVNDPFGGAAFSANGGTSVTEFLTVRSHPGLDDFLGTNTVAGTTINSSLGPDVALARITITQVPEPSTLILLGGMTLIGLAWNTRRQR